MTIILALVPLQTTDGPNSDIDALHEGTNVTLRKTVFAGDDATRIDIGEAGPTSVILMMEFGAVLVAVVA